MSPDDPLLEKTEYAVINLQSFPKNFAPEQWEQDLITSHICAIYESQENLPGLFVVSSSK